MSVSSLKRMHSEDSGSYKEQSANRLQAILAATARDGGDGGTEVRKPSLEADLTREQLEILSLVKAGHSLFFTGKAVAGTGKTTVLLEIVRELREKYEGQPRWRSRQLVQRRRPTRWPLSLLACGPACSRKRERELTIETVSALSAYVFDRLDETARIVRDKNLPFGGIQVVLTGDFMLGSPTSSFAFEARCWGAVVERHLRLTRSFCHRSDDILNEVLSNLRYGRLSDFSISMLEENKTGVRGLQGFIPTEICPTEEGAELVNLKGLKSIKVYEADTVELEAEDSGELCGTEHGRALLDGMLAVPKLTLCVEAQVMLIKSLGDDLPPGKLGRVCKFAPADVEGEPRWPMVCFKGNEKEWVIRPTEFRAMGLDNKVALIRRQIPLILGWAMSVEKAKNRTLELVRVNHERRFLRGQLYVALSRTVRPENKAVGWNQLHGL
ncbi:hypothetical protein B0H10DRAFT_1952595 [Mycena sp. CBHHK59/15]|nr:hypothetical protein B0H10DRAFT_1952595 [Mycena sp. CBHHK59/15]